MRLKRQGINVHYSGDRKHERLLEETLSMFHPQANHIPAFRENKWDGIVYFCNRRRHTFKIGMLDEAEEALQKAGIEYTKEGFEDKDFGDIKWSPWVDSDQRDYQRFAIIETLKKGYGITKIPTRGGKTVVSTEFTRILLEQNEDWIMCFFVDSADLYQQSIKEFAHYFNVDESNIGTIREGKIEPNFVTVAMVQSVQAMLKTPQIRRQKSVNGVLVNKMPEEIRDELHRKKALQKMMKDYLKDVDIGIVDEIQEYYSKERMKIIESMEGLHYLMSLSATPYKKLDPIGAKNIKSITGGIVYEIKEETLVEKKVLAKNRVLLLLNEVEDHPDYRLLTYRELEHEVITMSEQRNAIISTVVGICEDLELKTLGMIRSKEHGYYMDELLGKIFLSGDADEDARMYVKEWFLEGKGKVLFASDIWKKGITLPEVEVFINCSGGKEESTILQKRGRVLGATKDKEKALAIDIIDNYDRYFSEHSLNRIDAYETVVGEENIDIIDASHPEFPTLLEQYMREWFDK